MLRINIQEKSFHTASGQRLLAVSGLQFEVGDTEFVCLVGPSGCGKTTSLRIFLGLDSDYTGEVVADPGPLNPAAVFQEPRLLPWRTVEENVRLALPREDRQRNLDVLFESLGLQQMRAMYPGELSLGLARRAAIARAFAFEPSVLVLDEPFVSLDEGTADRLRALLLDVWQSRPTAIVMVTHNVNEAVRLADRVLLLSERPARVIRSVSLEHPRDQRDAQWVREQVKGLAP